MIQQLFANAAGEWLSLGGPENDVVVSTRARLARNVRGFRMPWRMRPEEKKELEAHLAQSIQKSRAVDPNTHLNLVDLDEVSRQVLVERHLISRELAQSTGDRGVIFTPTEAVSIMTNEEDHLRLQVIRAGFRIGESYEAVDKVDDALAGVTDYAFSPTLGYLTACPTNLGTALRISVMAHLPMLVRNRQIEKVHRAAAQVGLVIRGLYGEGTKAYGDFFQISNQMTLGRSEKDIVGSVHDVVLKIIEWERGIRSLEMKNERGELEGRIRGAFDVLKGTQRITFDDTMKQLSSLRLGVSLGLAGQIDLKAINDLVLLTQPAHLHLFRGPALDGDERDRVRADFIRERLKSDNN